MLASSGRVRATSGSASRPPSASCCDACRPSCANCSPPIPPTPICAASSRPAYEDDADEAEYRRLMRTDLVEGRRQALRVFQETIDNGRLSLDEAEAWLTALNDLRLVLGTRLDVSEDTLLHGLDPREPRARELALHAYLSGLQEELVAALGGAPTEN
jgi:Domain of unknown function (DUF2017)